jgi:hypothetical protein
MTVKTGRHSASTDFKLPLKKRIRPKKQVSFGRNRCRLFKADMSEAERSQLWYKSEDYQRIQADIHEDLNNTVSLHRKKDPFNEPTDELCVRGLESLLSGPMHSRRRRRRHFVGCFLHAHRYVGVMDPLELRAIAISLSDQDEIRAQHMAEYDAYEAYRVHREYRDFQSQLTPIAAFDEFDNVPKAKNLSIGTRSGERTVVPPIA